MNPPLPAITLDDPAWERFSQTVGSAANACFQCGACTATCPWNTVRDEPFSVRTALRAAQLGLDLPDGVWLCTTCAACQPHCPREVPIPQVIRSLRALDWQQRHVPPSLVSVLWSLYWDHNPYHRPPSEKGRTAQKLGLPRFNPKQHDVLFYTGCTGLFDRRAQKNARALISILQAADVKFGSLWDKEPCCGESAFNLGQLDYFNELAQENMELFQQEGVSTLVTLSPHCSDVFTNHYPAAHDRFRPLHYTQFLAELLQAGRLPVQRKFPFKVAFQDPCYLGRKNRQYEAPRALLTHIPELQLLEFPQNREESLCCGGGGGRMFFETAPKERFSNRRIAQARQLEADVIAAACPFCITCLEESANQPGPPLKIYDITEILALSIAPENRKPFKPAGSPFENKPL
jgi:Fe-S oxidoreductase